MSLQANTEVTVIVAPESILLSPPVSNDCTLQLTNVSSDAVMFRILTTSPVRYAVKSTKGVILPNATATITIVLNEAVAESCRDDFKLEYCVVSSTDVIQPRSSNVPDLIRVRKQAGQPVFKKIIRCKVAPAAAAASAAAAAAPKAVAAAPGAPKAADGTTAAVAGGNAATASATGKGAELKELEKNTLAEKNRRNEAALVKAHKKRTVMLFFAVLAVGLALWFSLFGY